MTSAARSVPMSSWRTPAVIVICGCLIAVLTFGPRSAAGLFLTPISLAHGWGRDVFGMALAIQNLLWGVGQPFAGAIADRFGTIRVIGAGAILYAAGLMLMAHAATPATLELSAGVLLGLGLSGCSFNIVIGAFGKLVPPDWRSVSLGAGTAAGSFGQFLFSPLGVLLIDRYGWQNALMVFGALMLLVLPLSLALATPRSPPLGTSISPESGASQTLGHALAEAFEHPSYVLLVLGFFTAASSLPSSPCIFRLIWSTAGCLSPSAAGPWR